MKVYVKLIYIDKEMVMNSIGLLAKDRRDMGIIRKTVEAYSGNIVS